MLPNDPLLHLREECHAGVLLALRRSVYPVRASVAFVEDSVRSTLVRPVVSSSHVTLVMRFDKSLDSFVDLVWSSRLEQRLPSQSREG